MASNTDSNDLEGLLARFHSYIFYICVLLENRKIRGWKFAEFDDMISAVRLAQWNKVHQVVQKVLYYGSEPVVRQS